MKDTINCCTDLLLKNSPKLDTNFISKHNLVDYLQLLFFVSMCYKRKLFSTKKLLPQSDRNWTSNLIKNQTMHMFPNVWREKSKSYIIKNKLSDPLLVYFLSKNNLKWDIFLNAKGESVLTNWKVVYIQDII